jgi:hypothetical protein
MSVAKNLSGSLVDAAEQNPRRAFLAIPLGAALIWWGTADAKYFQSMREKPTHQLRVTSVHDAPNHRGFNAPHVFGETPAGEVSFMVSPKESRRIEPGQEFEIIETGDSTRPYVTRETLDSQLSSIYFNVGPFPFNHIAILGSVIALGGLGWGLFGKGKAAPTPPAPPTA